MYAIIAKSNAATESASVEESADSAAINFLN